MIRTKKAKKILNKKEQRHLTESGINSMAALERQAEFMKERKAEGEKDGHGLGISVCLDCWFIARKFDLV
jgi:hypothetical protein